MLASSSLISGGRVLDDLLRHCCWMRGVEGDDIWNGQSVVLGWVKGRLL